MIASSAGWETCSELARGAGSWSSTAAITLAGVSPANARRPVIISYSTHPKANTSVRVSTRTRLQLLGRHVLQRAEERPSAGQRALSRKLSDARANQLDTGLGEPKIQQLGP